MRRLFRKLTSVAGAAPLSLLLVLVLLPTTACGRRARGPRPPPLPPPPSSATADEPKSPGADASGPQMSEAERKAAARAAFTEGVQLQEKSDCARALPRFESAQRLFEAPTHLLHIAECQAATGRLVEAQESYATLAHLTLSPGGPSAFREAQEAGRVEMAKLKPRVPTLRLDTSPPPASLKGLTVQLNGTQMPPDLVGIARPINPGRYHVTMTTGAGKTATGDVEIKEGEAKALEVRFSP
jgi:hypothetical protein